MITPRLTTVYRLMAGLSVGLLLLVALGSAFTVRAETFRVFLPLATHYAPFTVTPLGDGFAQVTAVTHAGDERLFIVERAGRVKILHPDGRISTFLDISSRVVSSPGELGMFDLAFHPGFTDPASPGYGFFYVSYTRRQQDAVHTFISRFRVTANPDLADANSEAWLSRVKQDYIWHKGGALDFDPATDTLYAGLGDDRQYLRAQDPASPKGKIVGLAVDAVPAAVTGDATGYVDEEVWALGLRNPWRLDIDPPTGRVFVGDVGEKTWEEINLLTLTDRYTNFGWPCFEGTTQNADLISHPACTDPSRFTAPVAAYQHEGVRCAVTGGVVYRPASKPNDGRYIYGDLCSGEVYALSRAGNDWQTARLGTLGVGHWLVTFGEDAQGNLYAGTSSESGPIYSLHIPPAQAGQLSD